MWYGIAISITIPYDVNDAGDAVGYFGHVPTIANHAFLYETRSDTPVPLAFPPGSGPRLQPA
jgi:hypothetical protein